MNGMSSYLCEQCGDATTGDALCPPCLRALERTAHQAKKGDSGRAHEAIDLACIIRERLRRHLVAKGEHCAPNPSGIADLIDAERARSCSSERRQPGSMSMAPSRLPASNDER